MNRTVAAVYRRGPRPKHKGANTIWRRNRDNWEAMVRIGVNPDLGTIPAKYFLFGILSAAETSAARRYAEVLGRYDRYHNVAGKRSVASPAYQRGWGRVDEITQHEMSGTINEWTRKARNAADAFNKMLAHIPTAEARTMLDEVCILDREISSAHHGELKIILERLAKHFQLKPKDGVPDNPQQRSAQPHNELARVAEISILSLSQWFDREGVKPTHYRLLYDESRKNTRGLAAYGKHESGTWYVHWVLAKVGQYLPAQVDMALLKAAEAAGWIERERMDADDHA